MKPEPSPNGCQHCRRYPQAQGAVEQTIPVSLQVALLSGAVCTLGTHRLLARGPFVQFVGQIVRHLGREARSFASGRYLQSMALADEGGLPPDIVANDDLVGSVTMDARTHLSSPVAVYPHRRQSAPSEIRNLLPQ